MTLAVLRDLWTSGTYQVTCATGTRSSSDAPNPNNLPCQSCGMGGFSITGPPRSAGLFAPIVWVTPTLQVRCQAKLPLEEIQRLLETAVQAWGMLGKLRSLSCTNDQLLCIKTGMAQSEKVSIGEHCEDLSTWMPMVHHWLFSISQLKLILYC